MDDFDRSSFGFADSEQLTVLELGAYFIRLDDLQHELELGLVLVLQNALRHHQFGAFQAVVVFFQAAPFVEFGLFVAIQKRFLCVEGCARLLLMPGSTHWSLY